MKIIEDWGNPFNLIEWSDQWRFIKWFNAEPSKRAQQYWQYVLARALLTWGKDLPQEIIDVIKSSINWWVVNYLDEHLTEDWILDEDRTLDELLARAYTNTADIANNWQLRDIYRQRILSLASDWEISLKDVDYIESLINTLQFAWSGSGFSDVLKYEYLTRAARNLWIDVPSSRWKDFWNSIINLFKKDQKEFQRSIAWDFVKLWNWIELTNRQLLELVADMLWNININKLIASDTLTDRELLNIAWKYLIWDAVAWWNRLIELFSAAKNAPATDDTRWIILKTITGQNIDKWVKVWFFDFRRWLKADPSVDMRAKFFERLSNANTLELPSGSIEDITDNLERKISEFKWWYILVNDSQYKMSRRLTDAIDKFNQWVEKAEDKITVIYPAGGLMWTITSDGWRLIYRTSYTNLFNQLVRNISIRMLWQSDVDTRFSKELQEKLLWWDVDALTEYNRLLEEDAQKYFWEMLWVWEEAYKEKLQPMLEQATGISFKNYDAITDKVAFWKKVDENFILTTKVNGNMEQEFVTVWDVIKQVDSMTPNQMASDLSNMFWLEITAKHISDWKKINDEIRDAYLAYKLSETPIELLERKWKLLALLNWGTADNITVNQFKSILQSWDFSSYKELFFHNLDLSDEELAKHAKSINDMVFNSLCAEAAMNLVKMWYSLPMVNIRDLVYDFLMDRLNVNWNFARAFLFKNWLPDTLETLRGIVNEAMPKDLRFWYDDWFKLDTWDYYNSIWVRKEGWWDPRYKSYIDVLTDWTLFRDWYRRRWNTANWINLVDSSIAVNAPSAINWMSVKQLADMYWVPLFVAADSWLDNIWALSVLWRTNLVNARMSWRSFVQSMINLRKTIPEWTASHELFHAIFLTMAPEDTRYFIDEAKRLYNYDERVANEMLADLFSEYFRTWSFSLPRQKAAFRNTAEEQRFISWIKQFFWKMAAWLWLVDTYEKQIGKLFDDIIDWKIKTTKSALTSDQIKIWNAQFANSWRNSYLPNNSRINHREAQAKMIMLVDSRISQLIDWKVTFSEYKKALGKEFPGLKSYFDSVKKSELDLKSKTIGWLDYGDWRRAYFNEEWYAKHDWKVTPDDIIKGFIDATSGEFADTRYRYLINTLLDVDENILLSQDVPYTTTRKHWKYLLNDLYDMANLEREYYLAKIDNWEVVYWGSTSYPSRAVVALDNFIKRLERDIKKRPKVRESAELSSLYTRIKWLEWQDFNEVLDKITWGWYWIPVEIWIFVDENWKIVSIWRWWAKSISPSSEVPSAGAETFYHSHPEVWRFSWHNGPHLNEGWDLVTFARMPYKNVWLINPGWVVLTFENTDKFRMIADSAINPLLQAITWWTPYYSNRWGTIQAWLITSLMTWEFDKQNWWVFDSVVKRNANKVKFIVDKYNVADFDGILKLWNQISDADKRALEMLWKIIKDEVRAYSLYYITHWPYVDAPVLRKWIWDMFNYSNTEDTMWRYLTKWQEKFWFATVKDVKEILPSWTKLNFVWSNDDDIVRAYFSVSDASDAWLWYDVYFMPTRMGADWLPKVPSNQIKNLPTSANACYIRISSPDKIVQSTDKLFSIMSRDDMLYRIYWDVSYRQLYKAISNAPEDITIKEFLELIEEALPATFIWDGIRQVFFDVIDWYYDKSKEALHLFYYDDVKDANNLNPKNVPNVYFQNWYGPTDGFIREFTDPATWIKYKLTPDDFVNVRWEWRLKTEFVPIEELDKLKEFDRRVTPKFRDSDDIINDLKEKFKKEWIQSPLYIHYSLADWKAYLAEWNHRLAAAKELWMEYLPVWVDVSKKTPSGQWVKVVKPKPFWPWDFYPDTMAPSDIWIKGAISPFNWWSFDNVWYATYNKWEVDNTWRAISDQQDDFFEESQYRDNNWNILTLYRWATTWLEEADLWENLRYRWNWHLKIFLTPSRDIVKYFGGITKKRWTKLKDVAELEGLLNRDETLHRYDINTNFVVRDLGNWQYEVVKQHEYLVWFDAPESYFRKTRENWREITRTKIWKEKMTDGSKSTRVREDEVMLKWTLRDIDEKLDRVLYPIDPVLTPYNPHYYEVYWLSKNPLVIDAKWAEWNKVEFNWEKMTTDNIADWAYDNWYDWVIFKNVKEQFYRDWKPLPGDFITDDYVVFSQWQLKSVDNKVPTEWEHWRDNTWYSRQPLVPDYKPRLIETKNQFVQDTYSSLIAMAAVKNWERIPSLWNEEQQLERILNDYYNAVAKATENWKTLSFAEAQKLKVKAWYALDMFEQDYVLPRYKNFLTSQERSELMWLKYWLAVGVNSDSLKTIKDYNDSLLNRYRSATQHIISQSDLFVSGMWDIDVQKEIEKRQEQLMRQWATLKEVDWQVIVVDTRDELFKELQNIPNNVIWLENLRALWRNWLAQLSNEEAYFLLNLVQLTKNMENKTNLIIQTIYKVSPQLARIDFFNAYRLENNLPRILNNNTLSKSDYISKFNNTTDFDRNVKQSILAKIKEKFARNWKLEYEELGKIIDDSFDENVKLLWNTIKKSELKQVKKEASLLYTKAFQPYTYLKDVPKEVKVSIWNILSEQQKWIRQALSAMWDNNKLIEVMDNISIYGLDWTVKTFREAIDWEPADINKILFNSDNEIIAWADELAKTPITTDMSNYKRWIIEKENAEIVKWIENNYEEWLRSYMNGSEMVSQAERDLLNTTLTAARQIAKKYTSTNTIAETDNALASINEEIIRRFKADILWLTWKFSKWWQRWDIWTRIQGWIMDKWERVQDRYAQYYSMSDDQLLQIRPNGPIDTMALNMAKYFKEIERRLWSADWLTWVTTDAQINRAFWHLWQVVMNIKTINGLYSLMSWIEWNQILKFFRFSNPKQLSYVKRFVIGWEWKETLGWYRTYVDRMDEWLDRDWFNKTFATNFSQSEYRKIVQALTWFTIINKKWKRVENALNFANSSNYLFRALMSYPWQLITIANQTIAYFLKQKGREDNLWIEDLWTIDEIRKKTWILNWTYNEINWFNWYSPDDVDPTSFYNRYWVPDVEDVYKSKKFYSTDDIETIYAKIDEYSSSDNFRDKLHDKWTKILRNTDAYKDNANNIIDWIFARNFKNIAFVRALQSNSVMRFWTAEQFVKFMASDAPESMKKRLMEALASDSWKHFRNILWLWFSWLDRAVSWGGILPAWASNIVVWLTQLFNFRWAWWQNIARQTNNFFLTALKMWRAWFSKEWRDAIALFLARQPEFVNFSAQLFNDLRNSRRLVRFQDNGRLPDEDNEYDWMDFIEYAADNMQFASQWWQGIQSYWTTRILTDWWESVLKSNVQPDIYKDTYWVWAFFNSLQKNFWRNWKVPAFAIKAIAQWTTNWTDAFWAYLWNERWKLSFGTLRYMMNEDFTSYWYSTEMPRRRVWIPFILTWEPDEWDKAFSYDLSNSETWENIANWYDAKSRWDSEAASIYAMNLWDTAFNSSQLLWTVKWVWQIVNWSSLVWSTIKWRMDDMHFYKIVNPFDLWEAWDIIWETEAWAEIMKNWYYIPSNADDVKTFIDTIIWQSDFRPGNDWFNKSFFNFDKSWHMKNLEESNEKDAPMEMLLTNMKYLRDENREFVLDEKWNKIITNYWEKHMNALERNINDEDYLTKSNFNFIYDWVEANNSDPNYMLYKRLIWEWLAWNYLEQKANQYFADFNAINWYKKGTKKMNLTELKNSDYYDKFIPALSSARINIKWENVPFLEALATLDENALMEADVKIVEKQLARTWDKEQLDKFFSIDKKWNVNLTTKYESFLMEQWRLSRYLRDWDLDSFLAETASITKVFKKDDPYGLMTTTLLWSRVNMINSSDYLSSEQKAKAINVLFKDNSDFIQTHIPEMITEIWDKGLAEAYITQMNDSLYGSSIIADKLITDNEMNNSSSWRSAAKSASDSIKTIMADLAKAAWDSDVVWTKKYNYNFTPAKLNWSALLNIVWWKWYTPTAPTVAIQKYTPHSKFTLKKDVNRLVNWPKTQSVSKKKLLSKLESDTLKAFEAES